MSLYGLARYNTSPDMIKFACTHGIEQNPMYMKCDSCPNQSSCEIYFSNNPAPELSQREKDMIRNDLIAAREYGKTKSDGHWSIFRIVMTIVFLLGFLGYIFASIR